MNLSFLDAHATELVFRVMKRLAEGKPVDSQWIKENDLTIDHVENAFRICSQILASWLNKDFNGRFKILKEGNENIDSLLGL